MPIYSISRCLSTVYTSNMDAGCSQWGFSASTVTPQHHTGSAIPLFSWKLPSPVHVMVRHTDAPICPSTASPCDKTLCIHPIWMWDAVNGGSQPQPWHHNIIQARPYPIFPKTHPHLHTYYSIRVHPYAHPQHLKVLKHFVYIQYGCGMQSMGVFSLNRDTATSYRLGHTPFSLKSPPTCTFNGTAQGCAHMPIHSISMCKDTLYTSNMDVGCSQWGFVASTMTLQHHTGSAIPHFS